MEQMVAPTNSELIGYTTTALARPVNNVLEALQPFEPDDGQKGTFIVLRVAGVDKAMALRIINRKYRSWQHWRSTDEYFRELDDAIPELARRFGGEARVLRTALLDVHIIETGIGVFRKILRNEKMPDGMWAYAVKLAGLRIPMMGQMVGSGDPWEKLANAIHTTIEQRELVMKQDVDGVTSVMAKETKEMVVQPSLAQRQMASEIVQRMLEQAREAN